MRQLTVPLLLSAALAGTAACSDQPVAPAAPLVIEMNPSGSGDGQTAEVGSTLPLPLRVRLTRATHPVEGVVVSWAATPGSGMVGTASTTNVDGIAATIWVFPNTSGLKAVTATVSGAEGSPVAFQATATPGPAASFEIFGGDNQTVKVGMLAALPLVVQLRDAHSNPISGVDVEWALINGSVSLSDPSSPTGANGTAFTEVTGGVTTGPVLIRAIPDVALPSLDFNLTVVP